MKFLAGLLAVLSLAGCATTPILESSQSAAALDAWQLMGRVSLTRGEEGWHASLNWQQQGDHFYLKISGPLGQGGFQLNGDDRGVVLVDADGKTFAAKDADVLLAQVTDWQLPVMGLRYWIRGLPAPGAGEAQSSKDDSGRLNRLVQSGWTINYNRYQIVDDISLPDKLQLLRDDIAVRIVVDKWELGAVTAWLP
jgi:outer membrane lipoprotein LolB